ncbi:hypothetical protein [Saccharopolyspora gregorii]|uniref:hypothetical protein n=1 Tax=Saccharopolyspora gregorii TaxID=33914 RepID=UPI0031E644C0
MLGTTLFMNVVPQLHPDRFQLGSLAVHLIVPVVVYGLAEVIPVIQARSRQVVMQGYAEAEGPCSPAEAADPDPWPAPASGVPEPPAPPAPVPSSPSAEPVKRGPRLPAHVVDALKRARDQAAEEGRGFAPADVQQVVKVPDAMATAIHADLITT